MNDQLIAVLDEIEEFLEDQQDVVDGSYGVPHPNRAMSLLAELQEARRREDKPVRKLGFAAAVREYGDNWRQNGFAWNGESYRGMSPHTIIAMGDQTSDYDDLCHMKLCAKHGRMFQVGG